MALPKKVDWQCTWCNRKETWKEGFRPVPGKCPRKTGDRPHTWTKVKKY